MNIKDTGLYKALEDRKSEYIEIVAQVYKKASDFLPKINRVFVNYTGHGIEHSLTVMEYMFDLVTDISLLSDLEITCLIYSALLHDIGLVVQEDEIVAIREDKLICNGRKYSAIREHIQDDLVCIQECIRPIHGQRSHDFIMNMDKTLFCVPKYTACSFQEEVANICMAHTVDLKSIAGMLKMEDVKGEDLLNAQYVAMLLRIADYIDMDEKRAPIELYRFLNPKGYSDEEWRQHYIVSNKNKIESRDGNKKKIVLYGKSVDAKIHNKFLRYLDDVEKEIAWWTSYSRKEFEEKYWLLLEEKIENKIETVGFEISDLKLNMDYNAIFNLLMGEMVYGDKKYGLRELIQNSLDACKVMKEYAPQLEQYQYDEYVPVIRIILDYNRGQLRIRDNGIGMSEEVLTKYFLNIGRSYYKSKDYIYQGNQYCPIGNFGIGFLACFMMSNEVIVETKSFKEERGYALELYAGSEYVCKKASDTFQNSFGTMISLNLENAIEVFNGNVETIILFLQNTFLCQDIDIYIEEIGKDQKRSSKKVALKSYAEIIEGKCILDQYMNGNQFAIDIEGMPHPKNKFSQLELVDFYEDISLCRYNEEEKRIESFDLDYKEFKQYLHNNELMLIKIVGVKKQYSDEYQQMKELCNDDVPWVDIPRQWQKEIIFPISYQEEFTKLYEHGWSGNGTIKWFSVFGRFMHNNFLWMDENFVTIIKQCDLIEDTSVITVQVGVVSLVAIGDDRYIEIQDFIGYDPNEYNSATYWRGIRLEKARLEGSIDINGIFLGEYFVNINNRDIFPNISRDDLSIDDEQRIRKQMKYAICMHVLEEEKDEEVKKALERHFKEINLL